MGAYIDLLKAAQSGDTAAATVLYEQYQPLIKKLSWHDGIFDMDLYQTLSVAFLVALSKLRSIIPKYKFFQKYPNDFARKLMFIL